MIPVERQADVKALLEGMGNPAATPAERYDKLCRLFWSDLNYNRVNQRLPRHDWPGIAAQALADDPVLFATGAEDGAFHVIYARLGSDRLLLGQERPVVSRLLRDHPYAVFVFSTEARDRWHFLNVQYDDDLEKRRLFRRITVGPEECRHERLRTATERLALLDLAGREPSASELQKAVDDAFKVEAVTDEFFREYARVFEDVEGRIKGIRDAERKRLFAQRLFNRLMFIAFIQKKGWLKFGKDTDYLNALWENYQHKKKAKSNFYLERLKLLFFSGLNTASEVNLIGINRGGFLKDLIGQVPYLNGGLFEEDDEDRDTEITVPDTCINTIRRELFNRFNFTVTESTPLDVEVAVDPEMLGKVFEELVTGRHETGSYYTPKPIVSFMCREMLKGYLGECAELIDEHMTDGITIPKARELLARLSAIRVVDPACGSGAYLVGMLHELHALFRLLDTRAQQFNARDDYKRKLDIIQNNLYGVDIDPFAVNIARLRLWLSLAVDFEGQDPPPLPNLDFKIESGDSLTAPDPQHTSHLFRQLLIGQADKLAALKGRHMRAHGSEKREIACAIDAEEHKLKEALQDAPAPEQAFDWRVRYAEVFKEGGFHLAVANPPYGASVDDDVRDLYFDRRKDGPQSKDTYGLFIARALQLLRPNGHLSYIVSDTWRTIKTHKPLRRRLLDTAVVAHVIDLPPWVFDATVNTCILTLSNRSSVADHKLITADLRGIKAGDWQSLERNLIAVAAHGIDAQTTTYARYTYEQGLIRNHRNLSFFVASPRLYKLISSVTLKVLGNFGEPKQGLATADNEYYLRKFPSARGSYMILDPAELLKTAEIAHLEPEERRDGVDPKKYYGRKFVPFDKGGSSETDEGWLPNFYVPTEYFIDWSRRAVARLRTATIADVKRRKGDTARIRPSDEITRAAVVRNPEYYFKDGVTFSPTGMYSPTFRLGSGSVFGNKGSTIFFSGADPRVMLGVLSSIPSRYFAKCYLSHTVETGEEVISQLPIPFLDEDAQSHIRDLVNRIIEKQQANSHYPYHANEQRDIDAALFKAYGFGDEDVREVELWYCRRYPRLAEGQGMLAEVQSKYAEFLERCNRVMERPPSYWVSNPVLALVGGGEGPHLEFKETLEADNKTGSRNPGVLVSALKTIAAFLNTNGGTLLIGVSDSGEVKGLEKDYLLCNKHDQDGFEQKLRSLLSSRLDPAPIGRIEMSFERLQEGTVCKLDVKPNPEVVHLDGKEVYVRDGNLTRKLEGPTLTHWMKQRFSASTAKVT
jgi:type I restriction-modification system DNA methylase subunit